MAITPVGALSTTNPSGGATTTKSITTATAGDVIGFYSLVLHNARSITGITGGTAGASGWSPLALQIGGGTETLELWLAKVGTPGTADATITWNTTTAGMFIIHGDRQFTAGIGAGTVWRVDGTGSGQANASATTCAFPPKTPTGSERLYLGYGAGLGGQPLVATGGTPAGSVFELDSFDNVFTYNLSVSALVSPVSGAGADQQSYSVGALLSADVPRPRPQPYTARRRAANF